MNSFYTVEELLSFGFICFGSNVKISKKASIYGAEKIEIGNDVRIDDFCILSGKIKIGNNVHIAAYSAIFGGNQGVEFNDFSGVSSRVSIYACSDDYSGEWLTNPTVPSQYSGVIEGKVTLGKHAIIGASCVILPGVEIGEGCSVGSMSLINKSTESWCVYAGIPAKKKKSRKKELLKLEDEYLSKKNNQIKFKVGDEAKITKVITENDIKEFAEVSGDFNPLHLDEEFAQQTIFKGRVAHGMLSASFISNVIGNMLPGKGSIYLSQNINFLAPVRINDEVTTIVRVVHYDDIKNNVYLSTTCYVKSKKVVEGDAIVKVKLDN